MVWSALALEKAGLEFLEVFIVGFFFFSIEIFKPLGGAKPASTKASMERLWFIILSYAVVQASMAIKKMIQAG